MEKTTKKPRILKQLATPFLHYLQRLKRWGFVLLQIRGTTAADQWVLIRSALAAPFLSLKNLRGWQDPVLLADAQVNVKGVGKFFVRKRCDDLWHVLPWREKKIVAQLRQHLRPGDCFIDAGANIGFYSVLAAQLVEPTGTVLAIEMMPDTAAMLKKNLRLNQLENVSIKQVALSDESGQKISVAVDFEKYGQASIITSSIDEDKIQVEVMSCTLDEVTEDVDSVRLVKMDLEGAEFDAIVGGSLLLNKTQLVVFESCAADERAIDVRNQFKQVGFSLTQLDGNNLLARKLSSKENSGQQ